VEFTARAELYEKLEKARDLLSHALPSGDLGELVERAVDALIEQETRKRFGPDKVCKARKARKLKAGSRHVPVEIDRAVWERDNSQCTFVDGESRRCAERRFLTIEHRTPFALGGPPTLENLCLLCTTKPYSASASFQDRSMLGKSTLLSQLARSIWSSRPLSRTR
jgi:hypothetical protein